MSVWIHGYLFSTSDHNVNPGCLFCCSYCPHSRHRELFQLNFYNFLHEDLKYILTVLFSYWNAAFLRPKCRNLISRYEYKGNELNLRRVLGTPILVSVIPDRNTQDHLGTRQESGACPAAHRSRVEGWSQEVVLGLENKGNKAGCSQRGGMHASIILPRAVNYSESHVLSTW